MPCTGMTSLGWVGLCQTGTITSPCRAVPARPVEARKGGDALQSRWALSSWMLDAVAAAIAMEGCRAHYCSLDLVTEGRGSAPRQLLPLDPV